MGELTKLYNGFPEVIRMSGPREKSLVTNSSFILHTAPEPIFLYVTHTLHHKPNREKYHTRNIPPSTEAMLAVLQHFWGIENRDGQRDNPHPQHLQYPEAKEGKEFVPLVIEAVVLAGLDDAEEQEAGETQAPEHDEDRVYDLARMVCSAECQSDDC